MAQTVTALAAASNALSDNAFHFIIRHWHSEKSNDAQFQGGELALWIALGIGVSVFTTGKKQHGEALIIKASPIHSGKDKGGMTR